MTSRLFSPITLRGLTLPNRIVVSPMCQYSAVDGTVGDWHIMHLGQFAVGGAGLVMVEASGVEAAGRISPGCVGLYSDDNEAALARVIKFCREHSNAKIAIQLAHAGRKASVAVPWKGGASLTPETGAWQTYGPSAVPFAPGWHTPQALDTAGLARIKAAFVQAAERAARLGFDLVELHAAHGYLMHSFLSPISNKRTDNYGGSLKNRMRFPLEVFEAVRKVWPADKPLGMRVSASDWVPGGWNIEGTVALAKELKARGCDFMDVSSGGNAHDQKIDLGPGYQTHFSAAVRREAEMATMAVGLITEPIQAETILKTGQADMIALARGLLYDPRWPWHAAAALGDKAYCPPQYYRAHPTLTPR